MRVFWLLTLCSTLVGCAASAPEVRARLGQEYIGKNVDALVVQWGPPTSMFKMNSGQSSYVWQLSAVLVRQNLILVFGLADIEVVAQQVL
jgi:hypothetical protein